MTINNIGDLIQILQDQPQWAAALRGVLLSRELLELPEEFAKFVQLTNSNFELVNTRLERLETGQARLETRMDGLEEGQARLETRMDGLEWTVWKKAKPGWKPEWTVWKKAKPGWKPEWTVWKKAKPGWKPSWKPGWTVWTDEWTMGSGPTMRSRSSGTC
jgi:hypothetical protein